MNTDPAALASYGQMQMKVLDDLELVGQEAWDALASRAPTRTLFQTWAWNAAWWRACGGAGRSLFLAALYDGGTLTVLMPLFLEGRTLRFLGDGAADRLDILYDAGRSGDLASFFGPVREREQWDVMELDAIPDASPTWKYLRIVADDAGLFLLSVRKTLLRGLSLEGKEPAVTRALHLGSIAKHAGVFASRGKVSVKHACGPVPWKEFFVQHVHRWALRGGPSVFVSRQQRDLIRYMCDDPALRPGLVFTTLLLNGVPAGYHLGLIHGKTFYSCALSFDLALRRFSPDDVLWRELVAFAMKEKCGQVSFVTDQEPVIRRSAERTGTARTVRVFRSRREQWLGKLGRWCGKVPFFQDACVWGGALFSVAEVFIHRRRIVQAGLRPVSGKTESLAMPEVELLRRLRPELKDVRMLDIGIGRGRTSLYFAPLVKSYTGFDQDASLAALARGLLDDQIDGRDIFAADPRDMVFAADGVYDLILFGGEGIDAADEAGRRRIFEEVRRVGREGAWFCFSSRNLQSLPPGKGFGGVDLLRRWRRYMLMAEANPDLRRMLHQASAFLLDESTAYRSAVHYVTPKEQVRVLKGLGFQDIRVFSGRTGLEVRDWRRWDKLIDDSLHYLCRV